MGHRGAVFGMRVESQIWAVRVDRYKWRKPDFRCAKFPGRLCG